ncbi:LytR/AlgR family response regulator transcription factor [Microbulbifer yueqingensis]|uniref:Two component transcriptional regulator, LytTR family n=1 Tax=Microbulbifer yueqingensis TaxID=658219 RepID=A0A1G9EEM8_9GAMM|nr:LytTR family DNA-binding domain-containing protein [Microbulbifer yueqingensis]SDK74485.1 two component transcriptional regulator, LytTR family [Microbulbifer yueqingensis]
MIELGVLIVDDEPLARARLARQLGKLEHCELLGEAADAVEALEQVERLDPDLVLLDIEMPGDNGLQLARRLSQMDSPPALIFCTAHDEFALPAFATAAVGYLLKPVSAADLAAAVDKAVQLNRSQRKLAGLPATPTVPAAARRRIHAVSRLGVELLDVGEIRCFIADSKYVVAHHGRGETVLDESLRDLEAEFAGLFVRVHRGALVAAQHVRALHREEGGYRVELDGVGVRPAVSRRMLGQVKALLAEMA